MSAAPVGTVFTGLLPRLPEAGESIVISVGANGVRHAGLRRDEDEAGAPPASPADAPRRDVKLQPGIGPDAMAAWSWEPHAWLDHPDVLIADARRRGIGRLFISLTVADGAIREPGALRAFLRRAAARGIAVEAVEGDPDMIDGAGLAAAVDRARAIAAFQAAAPPAERLAGVQYDIEPYIRPGWRDRDDSYLVWADSVRALSDALGAPVDLVAPFWLAGTSRGLAMLDRAAPVVRIVTGMAYRTDPPAIERVAGPLLVWGARQGKPVRIALEAGPLDDETETRFVPAPSGTLALIPSAPPSVTLLDRPGAVPGARMFAAAGETHIRAAALSFLGDEAAMRRAAARLRPVFAVWPGFAGYAFHGVAWSAPAAAK